MKLLQSFSDKHFKLVVSILIIGLGVGVIVGLFLIISSSPTSPSSPQFSTELPPPLLFPSSESALLASPRSSSPQLPLPSPF